MKDNFKNQLDQFCRISSAFLAIAILLCSLIYLLPRSDYSLSTENINYIDVCKNTYNEKIKVWNFKGDPDGTDIYFTVDNPIPGSLIMMETKNTFVDIYANDQLILSDDQANNPIGLETNGYNWRKISLGNIDVSSPLKIRITCYPCYSDNICSIPRLYLGTSDACVFRILLENLPATVVSIFFSILAFILMGYYAYYYIRYKTGRDFLFVGIAIFTTSTWSALDTSVFSFTWQNAAHFKFLSDICFLLIPLSFGLICSYRAEGRYKIFLNVFTIICELNLLLSFLLFFIGGIDFYHTKWTTIILNIIAIPLLSRLVFTYQDEEKLVKNNVVIFTFSIILIACIVMWLARIKVGFIHDYSFLIRTSIISFNFCIIAYHAKMSLETFKYNFKRHINHEFEIKDRVTGFYNRTALTEYANKYIGPNQKSNVGIAYFKLRHVKMINETYGYENGTSVLQNFTSIIKSAFPENCDCYRIGTRKFYVFIPGDNPHEIYSDALTSVENNVKETNEFRNHPYSIIYDSSFVYDTNIDLFDLMDIAVERV